MIKLSSSNAATLERDACQVLENDHTAAWARILGLGIGRAQWEPHFVAQLCGSMAGVARKWRPTLRSSYPRLQLKASIIFTHQSPYVKWTSLAGAKRCELADVLIAFIDRTGSPPQGAALLIQAKQSDSGRVVPTTSSEKKQFELLSTRPIFSVDAVAAPRTVDLQSKSPDVALLYGLTPPATSPANPAQWIQDRWKTAHNLKMAGASHVNATHCLANTLVDLLNGNRGWSFDLPPPKSNWRHFAGGSAQDDWSMLINYLLDRSFNNPVRVLKAVGGPGKRHTDHTLCLRGHTPKGQSMFCLLDLPATSHGTAPLEQIGDTPGSDCERTDGVWSSLHTAPKPEDLWWDHPLWGGGNDDGGRSGDAETPGAEGPEDGPISAIVFEYTLSG